MVQNCKSPALGIAICAMSLFFGYSAALSGQTQSPDPASSAGDRVMRVPELPPADFDEALTIGGDEIEARQLRSRMTVEVSINGTGPHKFVVDSGADTSVIGTKLAAELALPSADPILLHTMTESTMVDRVAVDKLELGPSTITDLDLPVLRETDIGGDGMIGLDALVRQRLMLDFEERVITVEDEFEKPTNFGRNEIVVTGQLRRGQLILTEVEAEGHKVDAVIDTGTEVTIGNLALRDELIRRRPKDVQTAEIFGVTGATAEVEFAVIGRLEMGSVNFSNVIIAFADVPPFDIFGINDGPALLLGTDLMETFRRVSLDFAERKVRFQLKKCGPGIARLRTLRHATRLNTDVASACER